MSTDTFYTWQSLLRQWLARGFITADQFRILSSSIQEALADLEKRSYAAGYEHGKIAILTEEKE